MIFIIIATSLFGIDFFIKGYIEKNKKENEKNELIKDKVDIVRTHNKGALLSKFEDKPRIVDTAMLISLGSLLTLFFQSLANKNGVLKKLGTACILGGALSNVLERIKKGYVVDYINLPKTKLKNVVFNLSDCFIVIGTVITIFGEIFSSEKN